MATYQINVLFIGAKWVNKTMLALLLAVYCYNLYFRKLERPAVPQAKFRPDRRRENEDSFQLTFCFVFFHHYYRP